MDEDFISPSADLEWYETDHDRLTVVPDTIDVRRSAVDDDW